ncbi:hypothetical protein C8R44DRAFT_60461 [Mycena epipterygia]|nr:hypothetical protein C8R44DRAFT_60461 [Mycena epipterygia]
MARDSQSSPKQLGPHRHRRGNRLDAARDVQSCSARCMDVVTTGVTHEEVPQDVWRREVVHEGVIVERNCGRNVFDAVLLKLSMLTLPNKGNDSQSITPKLWKSWPPGGPVVRSLFGGVPVPMPESIENDIKTALRGNIFAFTPVDASGEAFIVCSCFSPRSRLTRRACLQRTDCSAEFLSAHIAHTTFDLAQDHLEKVQRQLAAALDTSATRSVVEAMMHRALTRGIQLPAVFGLQEPSRSSAKPGASSATPPRPISPSVRCTSGRNLPTLLPWTPSSRRTKSSALSKPPWAIRIAGTSELCFR